MCRCCDDPAMHALYLETVPRRPPTPEPVDPDAERNQRLLKEALERKSA